MTPWKRESLCWLAVSSRSAHKHTHRWTNRQPHFIHTVCKVSSLGNRWYVTFSLTSESAFDLRPQFAQPTTTQLAIYLLFTTKMIGDVQSNPYSLYNSGISLIQKPRGAFAIKVDCPSVHLNSRDVKAGRQLVYSGAYSLPYLPLSGIHLTMHCTCSSLSYAIAATTNGSVFSPCLSQTGRDGEEERHHS